MSAARRQELQETLRLINQAVIVVAGLGTRLLPLSAAIPKELLPVGRKPGLQWIAEELCQAGVQHLTLVTSPRKNQIAAFFDTDGSLRTSLAGSKMPLAATGLWSAGPYAETRISLAWQHEQRGLGHAVLCGADTVRPGPFVLALGDTVIQPLGSARLTREMIEVFEATSADAVIAFQAVDSSAVSRYGIADPDRDDRVFGLRDLIEKPSAAEAPSRLAVAARYVFQPTIFDYLRRTEPGHGGEIQLTDAIRLMIREGGRVMGVVLAPGEKRIDLGSYDDFADAFIEQAFRDNHQLRARWREELEQNP